MFLLSNKNVFFFQMFSERSKCPVLKMFSLAYVNMKWTFHFIILHTLCERYFWMFSEHSKTSRIVTFKNITLTFKNERSAKTYQEKHSMKNVFVLKFWEHY